MRLSDLNGKNICILGFGKEGQAMLKILETHAPAASITIADAKPLPLPTTHYPLLTGPDYLQHFASFDFVIKSPGIPPSPETEAVKKAGKLTSGTQLFLETIADSGAVVIGITGSKGKSTTATLICELLQAGGKDAYLVGNIGKPAIEYIDLAKPGVLFVLEMSSYQLMDLTRSPHLAVVTSFFPEHLDYHGSLEAYREAKKHIARFQTADDVIFFNTKSPGATEIANDGDGKKIGFSDDDAPVTIEQTNLIGRHNLGNIAGACKVAEHFGVPKAVQLSVLKTFQGLPHRLQSLGIKDGIEWIDDAISTTPDSAIAALDALGDRVHTIILGGQDRGVPFEELGKRIAASTVKTVILFPGSGPRIKAALQAAGAHVTFFDAPTMDDAVRIATHETTHVSGLTSQVSRLRSHSCPICLLSTASPSYGMFTNFEEKGQAFRDCLFR